MNVTLNSVISCTSFFFLVNRIFTFNCKKHNLVINYTSGVHAFGSTIMCLAHIISDKLNMLNESNLDLFGFNIKSFSSGYFIYDSIITLLTQKGLNRFVFLYHHIFSLLIINNTINYPIYQVLFWAELSNLPYYMVYYYLHQPIKDNKKIKLWKDIQKYLYFIVRVPIMSVYTYNQLFYNDHTLYHYMMVPVYFLGCMWSLRMFKDKKLF